MNKWRIYVAGIALEIEGSGGDFETLRKAGPFWDFLESSFLPMHYGFRCIGVDNKQIVSDSGDSSNFAILRRIRAVIIEYTNSFL